MASIKKKSSGEGGANWMDTYGDMVTLLLCFFVLLYSISSLDEAKWMIIVQSFNKNAIVSTDESPRGPEGNDANEGGDDMPMTQEDVTEHMEELYEFIQTFAAAAASDSGSGSPVTVSQGDGMIFVRFDNAVFFEGDKWDLLPEGKAALDSLIPALEIAGPYINEIKITGHTAQAGSGPNSVRNDRMISSNRAAEVLIYLQENSDSRQLDPARMISQGQGQWRPIADNSTAEGRAMNRRVEMTISGKDIEDRMADSIAQYYEETSQEQPEGSGVQVGVAPPADEEEEVLEPEADPSYIDLLGPLSN